MVNQQLVDWIKGAEAKGSSQKDITDMLVKQGWQIGDVNDALNLLHPQQTTQPVAQPAVQQQTVDEWGEDKPKKQSILPVIIIGVVCFILLVAAMIYKWYNP